jgi:hypothetical protein
MDVEKCVGRSYNQDVTESPRDEQRELPTLSTALLQRVRDMHPDGWSRLVEVFGPIVYRWCRQSGVPEHDAADNGLVPADPKHRLVAEARTKVATSRSRLNLKEIGLAFLMFQSEHLAFPASAAASDELPPHSWRVAILPHIGYSEQYRLNEPWDSDHNKTLLDQIPEVYRHSSEPQNSTTTCYVGFVSEHSMLGKNVGHKLKQITDGTANTLMVLEVKTSIPWTKPEDLTWEGTVPQLSLFNFNQILCCMADGRVIELAPTGTGTLGKLITIDGGELVSLK